MPTKNRQILLTSRPSGEPSQDNFQLVETYIPKPGSGQMLLRTIYLSLDPYMRGRMNAGPSYSAPVEIGEVMVGQSVCEVVESNVPNCRSGDIVLASTGWQEYSLSDGEDTRKIDRSLVPLSYALGVLGMPGFTAYAGLLNIGKPQSGETVVVAAASGRTRPQPGSSHSATSPAFRSRCVPLRASPCLRTDRDAEYLSRSMALSLWS